MVALLQTMIGRVEEYIAGYFDVVITDECHRSIYGAWQAALTRFDAVHIGRVDKEAVRQRLAEDHPVASGRRSAAAQGPG